MKSQRIAPFISPTARTSDLLARQLRPPLGFSDPVAKEGTQSMTLNPLSPITPSEPIVEKRKLERSLGLRWQHRKGSGGSSTECVMPLILFHVE